MKSKLFLMLALNIEVIGGIMCYNAGLNADLILWLLSLVVLTLAYVVGLYALSEARTEKE